MYSILIEKKKRGRIQMIQWQCYRNHNKEKDERIEEGTEPLILERSECPVCKATGKNTHQYVEVNSVIYWCEQCRIPLYANTCQICNSKGREIGKDIRPVFPEEKLLLELLWEKPIGSLTKHSVWNTSGSGYIIDGKSEKLVIGNLRSLDIEELRQDYEQYLPNIQYNEFNQMMDCFVRANEKRYVEITNEAIEYISEAANGYALTQMFTSFSGGKDSTVVADLVRRALATDKLLHIFGDTTLEFPDTEDYVARYRKEHPKTPFISSRNKDKDFMDLCKLVGPPSRVMRWCCTIFKTGAINRKITSMFKNQKTILSFQGIRRSESVSRSKYDRTSRASKIAKQVALAPIIDWLDFDIWLYLLTTGIDFNTAYRKGYTRVGCWCCPNNGQWSEFLSKVHMPEQFFAFHQMLVEFAKTIGKPDAEEYVASGGWKARQGGNGVAYAENAIVDYTPCVKEENAFNYELQRPITLEFYELFKPFGQLNFELGNSRLGEVLVLDKNQNVVLKLQGKIGKTKLKVTIYRVSALRTKSLKGAKEKIDCQITKYQMCMGCRGCESVCRFNAISIRQNKEGSIQYAIDEEHCVGCQECISHYVGGCYMRKVLAVKRIKNYTE